MDVRVLSQLSHLLASSRRAANVAAPLPQAADHLRVGYEGDTVRRRQGDGVRCLKMGKGAGRLRSKVQGDWVKRHRDGEAR